MKIGIILGSVREGRNGQAVSQWVLNQAEARNDANVSYEIVDLKEYNLPLLGTAGAPEQMEAIGKWSSKISEFDGYVIITPEYNRLAPGALKNAFDFLQPELHNKAVGYVSYGGLGGLSAIESLRVMNAEQELASVRTMVTFSLMTDFENMSVFTPADHHKDNADKMLSQLVAWSGALKTLR